MIKINDTEIEIETKTIEINILEGTRKPEDGDAKTKMVKSTNYSFFACTCDKKDEDFYKNLLKKEFPKDRSFISTSLIYSLLGEDWYLDGCYADQWMGITLKSDINEDTMFIQCDLMEYGLLAAYIIAKNINK